MKCFSDVMRLLTDGGVSDTVKNAQTGDEGGGGDSNDREIDIQGLR